MTNILSGPMFQPSNAGWRRSSLNREGGHYNIYDACKDPLASIIALRAWFSDDGDVNGMNFVLFSTSGVHGSYRTIEKIEESMAKYPNGPPDAEDWPEDYCCPEITFLVVQPRLVGMTFGLAKIRDADDIAWVKRVRKLGWKAAATVGR